MSTIVTNWADEFEGVQIRYDLTSPDLLHYGPTRSWSSLTVRPLGNQVTLIRGTLDFGFSSDQFERLKNHYPGKRLAALVSRDMINRIEVGVTISEPHAATLNLLHSVPFPKLQFEATVKHEDPDHASLVDTIKREWEQKSFFIGTLLFRYDMVEVALAYHVKIPLREAAGRLTQSTGGQLRPRLDLEDGVMAILTAEGDNWVVSAFPDGSVPMEKEVRVFLTQTLFAALCYGAEPFLRFDAGEVLEGYVVRNQLELVQDHRVYLTNTTDVVGDIEQSF